MIPSAWRRCLLFLALLSSTTAHARELPPPYAHGPECGIILPCAPSEKWMRGLAWHWRLGLHLDSPTPELNMGVGGWTSFGVSTSFGSAVVWLPVSGANHIDPKQGTRFFVGPLGMSLMLAPPFLRHLGGSGDEGGVSLAAQARLEIGKTPFDVGGTLYQEVQTFSLVASWEEWRLHSSLVASLQLADQGTYRGVEAGGSLWIRISKSVLLGGEVLARTGNERTAGDLFFGIALRHLDDSGIAAGGAGVFRVHADRPVSWRAQITFGLSGGPGFKNEWMVFRIPDLVLRGLGPAPPPPPGLPLQSLRLPEAPRWAPACVMSGPITKAMVLDREPLPPLVPALSDVSLQSHRACQFASYSAGGGGGGIRPSPRVRPPRRGGPGRDKHTWRPEYEKEPWRDPKFPGWDRYRPEDIPLGVWTATPPAETSIGPPRGEYRPPGPQAGEAVHTVPPHPVLQHVPRPQAGQHPAPSVRVATPVRGEAVHLPPVRGPASTETEPAVHSAPPARTTGMGRTEPPWGPNGKPDHQRTVEKLEEMAQREFPDGNRYKIHYNRSILDATGGKVNRKPDVWVQDRETGQAVKVYEAARQRQNGQFVSRERKKVQEYEAAGIDYHLEPVR